MERATGTEVYGCGPSHSTDITLNVQTTTGGNFTISLSGKSTVQNLKRVVSKKLKVSKDRICLLHRERQLRDGTLEENGLLDGSRVILLPSVETGLLNQKHENSVIQALEALNDNQVNDFLSGRSPLNLTMRLGDHMMLIQLQLSTLGSSGSRSSRSSTLKTSSMAPKKRSSSLTNLTRCPKKSPVKLDGDDLVKSGDTIETVEPEASTSFIEKIKKCGATTDKRKIKKIKIIRVKKGFHKVQEEDDKVEDLDSSIDKSSEDGNIDLMDTTESISDSSIVDSDLSPLKSLSSLVSGPMDASCSSKSTSVANTVKSTLIDMLSSNLSEPMDEPLCLVKKDKPMEKTALVIKTDGSTDIGDSFAPQSSFLTETTIDEYPMENLFNTAVEKSLFDNQDSMMDREISNLATTSQSTNDASESPSSLSVRSEHLKTKRFKYLHKTAKFKQSKQKAFMQSVVKKHQTRMKKHHNKAEPQPSTSRTKPYYSPRKLLLQPSPVSEIDEPIASTSTMSCQTEEAKTLIADLPTAPLTIADTGALIEASMNLTQTLKKLSRQVLISKMDARNPSTLPRLPSGAVIESMKHHGKGIYSGTFSGTLNPALQDSTGRPKRDISTIVHILNDLLCATPTLKAQQTEGKDDTQLCARCRQPSCSHTSDCTCPNHSDQCEAKSPQPCTKCSVDQLCKDCDLAKTLAMENSKTKCKLEQLRLVMQQKKERREARKLKLSPYPSPPKRVAPEGARPEEIPSVG